MGEKKYLIGELAAWAEDEELWGAADVLEAVEKWEKKCQRLTRTRVRVHHHVATLGERTMRCALKRVRGANVGRSEVGDDARVADTEIGEAVDWQRRIHKHVARLHLLWRMDRIVHYEFVAGVSPVRPPIQLLRRRGAGVDAAGAGSDARREREPKATALRRQQQRHHKYPRQTRQPTLCPAPCHRGRLRTGNKTTSTYNTNYSSQK